MAGSRSTAPLNRSNSVLIVARLSAFEIDGHVASLPSLQQILAWPHLCYYSVSIDARHIELTTPH
jgi:hypothetical protein